MEPRESEPYEHSGFVILNPYGQVWGPTVYDSPEAAQAHLERFWQPIGKVDLSEFRIVPGHAKVVGFLVGDAG